MNDLRRVRLSWLFRCGLASSLLFLLCASSYGQKTDKTLETEIRRLDREAAKAVLDKDEALIARFFTADSVTNNPRNTLTLGSKGIIDLAGSNIIDYHSFDRVIESVQLLGNTAVVMGNETVVMKTRDGGPGEILRRRYTNVWMNNGKDWRIVARHANIICPAKN